MHNLREAICYVRNVQAANASKQKGQQKKSGESNVRLLYLFPSSLDKSKRFRRLTM